LARFDAAFFRRPGVTLLAGVDEAGRGALAGPVVAAAVVGDASFFVEGLDDSKRLSAERRETLLGAIRHGARARAVGWASPQEIDRLNILQATLLAARRAIDALPLRPDLIVTDALKLTDTDQPVEALVKADAHSQVVAAASVVAKVTRDRWMCGLDEEYPPYGFARHKGYGVSAHLEALRRHGASSVHRHTFRGVGWFDEGYRTSATLERLIGEFERDEMDHSEVVEAWRGWGYALPECEHDLLCNVVRGQAPPRPAESPEPPLQIRGRAADIGDAG
jgi:ribonuclease HII